MKKLDVVGEAPLCACGCGEKVKWHKHDKRWNTYLHHHHKKNTCTPPNENPPLCACGCGNPVTWNKWDKRWNKVIYNHPINRGVPHTQEVKDTISAKNIAKWEDPEYREGMVEKFKNAWKDPCSREKREEAAKKNWKNPNHKGKTKEYKEKQGKDSKKRWEDKEYRDKITQAIKDRWADPAFKAKMKDIMTEARLKPECREKRSECSKEIWKNPERMEKQIEYLKKCWENPEYRRLQTERMQGENHFNWKGGISCEPYCKVWTFPEFKDMIRERDGHKCQNPDCWKKALKKEKPTVHHIDYNKKNCHPTNLTTVCRSCNGRANVNRKYWQEYYTKIMTEKFKEDGMTKKRHKIIKRAVQTKEILSQNERR